MKNIIFDQRCAECGVDLLEQSIGKAVKIKDGIFNALSLTK